MKEFLYIGGSIWTDLAILAIVVVIFWLLIKAGLDLFEATPKGRAATWIIYLLVILLIIITRYIT